MSGATNSICFQEMEYTEELLNVRDGGDVRISPVSREGGDGSADWTKCSREAQHHVRTTTMKQVNYGEASDAGRVSGEVLSDGAHGARRRCSCTRHQGFIPGPL